ncbi:MAG: alginate export family protein [Deltaproteobacteria bacterium]|nr:alginate export family protein [Deltaproteobacteria bacterium]
MKATVCRTLVVYLCLAGLPRMGHGEITVDSISPKLSVAASLRTRWELWNWFEPTGTQNNDYDFIGAVGRASVKWKDDPFELFVEGQSSALIDLPTTASAPAPQGNLGLGGVYFQHNRRRNDASVFLKQGYLTLKQLGLPGLSIKGGRFEFSEGNEVLSGDASVDWLKNTRLAQRLIGSFGWSDVGRAFDGGVVAFNRAPINVTLMASHPTEGGFDLNGMHSIDDIDLGYAALNFTKLRASSSSDARLFYIYYDDRRHQTKSDNRPLAARNNATERSADINLHTGGGHLIHVASTPFGSVDGMLWGVLQGGDWGRQSDFGWSWDVEAGWQPALPWKPWIRAGYTRSSGDDNPNDDKHKTFFQILPTARIYSFSTFYNLMNTQDAFGSLLLRPITGLVSRTELHVLRLTESHDLWYQGSGATLSDRNRAEGFGFPGRPANGQRELFTLVETSIGYDWNRFLNTNLYYGHAFGGAVVNKIYSGSDADFGYLELTLKI